MDFQIYCLTKRQKKIKHIIIYFIKMPYYI